MIHAKNRIAPLLALLLGAQTAVAAQKSTPPAVKAPAVVAPAKILPAPTVPAAQAAAPEAGKPAVAAVAQAVAEPLKAAAAAGATDAGAAQAMGDVQRILQGGAASAPAASVQAPEPGAGPAPLAASDPAASKSRLEPPSPRPSDRPAHAEPVSGIRAAIYEYKRSKLAAVAAAYGLLFSLPQASPALTQEVLRAASHRTAILSDIDDTLTKYNTQLPQDVVEAIAALRQSGKTFAAITDRPDFAREGSSQMGALKTFETIPADKRAGIIVATNGGGKIYRYDAAGVPQLVFEEPPIPAEEMALIEEAAKATAARLAEVGTALDRLGGGPYGMSIMITLGTKEEVILAAAAIYQQELDKRGLKYHVEGKQAKNPQKDPPYLTFSKLDKSLAVKRIAELEKLSAAGTVLIGDSMYKPSKPVDVSRLDAKAQRRIARARRLAGRDIPLTGNATDRNMEKGLPGALTLSVGETGDPTLENGWVLQGKGPAVTRSVLEAMAQGPRDADGAAALFLMVLLAAGVAFVGVMAAEMMAQGVAQANRSLLNDIFDHIPF